MATEWAQVEGVRRATGSAIEAARAAMAACSAAAERPLPPASRAGAMTAEQVAEVRRLTGEPEPRRERVGVVELRGANTTVRVECRPEQLRRWHLWLDAAQESNGWPGRVRSWEEDR